MPRSAHLCSIALLLLAILALCACQQPGAAREGLARIFPPSPLRVGIVGDNPPLAYRKDGAIAGLEAKFAQGLAAHLGKPLTLVELPSDRLTQALLDKQIDIAMAGLTAADIQDRHLSAATPYLISGQTTLVHLNDFIRLAAGTRNLTDADVRLGVIRASAGDTLLKRLQPEGTIIRYATAKEGVRALLAGSIDAFLHDMPANFFFASLHVEQGLTPGRTPLTREPVAWALRPGDTALRQQANAYLAALKKSGELQQLLEQTIPFYKNTAYSPKF